VILRDTSYRENPEILFREKVELQGPKIAQANRPCRVDRTAGRTRSEEYMGD
jgi:hypothetical protein